MGEGRKKQFKVQILEWSRQDRKKTHASSET